MKPKNSKNHVGIEIEFYSPVVNDVVNLALGQLYNCEYQLGYDGSIRPPRNQGNVYHGYELRLLIEQSKVNEVMETLSVIFKSINAKVNASCGLHVHLDCRTRKRDLLFNNLVNSQGLFAAMQPKTRRSNRFCRPNPNMTWEHTLNNYGRYLVVNPHSYDAHSTLEVRIHKGTVNTKEIANWVNLLIRIASKRKQISNISSLEDLKKHVKLKDNEEEYVEKKLKRYSKLRVA